MTSRSLPPEIVTFEEEDKSPVVTEDEPAAEEEEQVGEDEFSKKERRIFAEMCPDINLEVALKYCMDSKDFTIQMLSTFTDAKRAEKIQAAFDARDWKNYQILVHALKSTSLSIGAEHLSEAAKKLELAAKENVVEEILTNHAGLMADYGRVRTEIGSWLEKMS